ncbi:hypothetical protein FRC02_007428 [Tulasnella sp. 418]|nr:hypothetical protein FRC02_007428 [Tulasnella sp. 418]
MSTSQVQLSPSSVAGPGPSSSRVILGSIPYVPVGPQASTSSSLPHPPLSEALASGSHVYHTLYSVVVEAPGERPRVVLSQNPLKRHGTRILPIDNPIVVMDQMPTVPAPAAVEQVAIPPASPAPSDASTEIDERTPPPSPPPPAPPVPMAPLVSRRSCSPTAHAKKMGVQVRDFLWENGWQKKIDDYQKAKREEEARSRMKTEEAEETAYLHLHMPGPSTSVDSPSLSTSAQPSSPSRPSQPASLARATGKLIVLHKSPPPPNAPQISASRPLLPSTSNDFSLPSSSRRVSDVPGVSASSEDASQSTQVSSQPEASQQAPFPSQSSTASSQPGASQPRTRKRKADGLGVEPIQPTRSSSRIREKKDRKKLEDKLAERAKRRKISK